MIKKLGPKKYRLYSRKKTGGKRKNLGTYSTRSQAQKRERQVQFFKKKKRK